LLQYVFVAGSLALVNEPLSEPPDRWVEPKQRLDHTVGRPPEIVTAANMREFMGDDRGINLDRDEG
jgi:hypothetical protein